MKNDKKFQLNTHVIVQELNDTTRSFNTVASTLLDSGATIPICSFNLNGTVDEVLMKGIKNLISPLIQAAYPDSYEEKCLEYCKKYNI